MTWNSLEAEAFVVLSIKTHQLALPLKAVIRVINCPTNVSSDFAKIGLVQLERCIIKVIDLYQYLNLDKSHPNTRPILVVTSNKGSLYGILTCEPPTLINFSHDMLQALPKANYQQSLLSITSHAVITKQETNEAIFLLDMKRVLEISGCG